MAKISMERKIAFVKMIASDYGYSISDKEAKKCLRICGYDHERIKEYFYA